MKDNNKIKKIIHKDIICFKCNNKITHKDDLYVIGSGFQPFHKKCFKESKKDNDIYTFMTYYSINGNVPIILGVIFNILFLLFAIFSKDNNLEFILFALYFDIIFILIRGFSYYLYERHLKN